METSLAIGTHEQNVAYKIIIPNQMWHVLMTWTTISIFQPVAMNQTLNAMQALLCFAGGLYFVHIFIFLCSSSLSLYHSVQNSWLPRHIYCFKIAILFIICNDNLFSRSYKLLSSRFELSSTTTCYFIHEPASSRIIMMTSSNDNIFHVTGPLCGEFTGHRWIPRTMASDAELWCFLWSALE